MQKQRKLIVPVVTPKIDSYVDEKSMANILASFEGIVDYVFSLGTTGEFRNLSIDKKKQVIDCVVRNSPCPVLIGVSDEDILISKDLAKYAADAGANAIVYMPMLPTGEIERNLNFILDASPLGIILYNFDKVHWGVNTPFELYEKYCRDPRVLGIKDSSDDWDYFKQIMSLRSADFKVYQGSERLAPQSLAAGVDGLVAGTANIDPELFRKYIDTQNPEYMAAIVALQNKIKNHSSDYIKGLKCELFLAEKIQSDEMFYKQ